VGAILQAALRLYRRHPLLFLLLAAAVVAPYELIELAVTKQGWLSVSSRSVGTSFPLDLVQFALVGPLVSALHIHAVLMIGERRQPRLASVALKGLRVLPVVVAAQIVAVFGVALGLIAFIVPGIILAVRWAVVSQAAALEHEGWLPALRRSWALSSGSAAHIFWLLFATGLINGAIKLAATAAVVGDPLSTHSRTASSASGAPTVLFAIVIYTITASFSALTLAILYFDLRARREPASGVDDGTAG
jgi:hypothetical protein